MTTADGMMTAAATAVVNLSRVTTSVILQQGCFQSISEQNIWRQLWLRVKFFRSPFADRSVRSAEVVIDVQISHSVIRSTAGAGFRAEIGVVSRQTGPMQDKVAGRRRHNGSQCDKPMAGTFWNQVWSIVPHVVALLALAAQVLVFRFWRFAASRLHGTVAAVRVRRRPRLTVFRRVHGAGRRGRAQSVELAVHLVDVALYLPQRLVQRLHAGDRQPRGGAARPRARRRHDAELEVLAEVDADALAAQRLAVLVVGRRRRRAAGVAVAPVSRPPPATGRDRVVRAARRRHPPGPDARPVHQPEPVQQVRPVVVVVGDAAAGRHDGRRQGESGRVQLGALGHQARDEAVVGAARAARHVHPRHHVAQRVVVVHAAAASAVVDAHPGQPVGDGQRPTEVRRRTAGRRHGGAERVLQAAGVRAAPVKPGHVRQAAR